jgi:ribonuclease VapC
MPKVSYIFDSHALLKLFQQEKGYEKIIHLLKEIESSRAAKYLNAINVGEIIYITTREFGEHKKIEALASIERLGFSILSAPNQLIFQAAEYKARYSISYADCFVLASAVEHKATIVTGDPEFKKVDHVADVFWI